MSNNIRIEEDLLGTREVPADAYYGVHTLRAIENFYLSNNKISDIPEFVRGMVMVKKAAAMANKELQTIPKSVANAIIAACDEVLNNGKCMDQFPVDVYQGGAGTSVNMNTNEVLANIGLELMGHQKGEYQYLNPNDHVNKCQSTNDAYPTGFRIAVYSSLIKLVDAINQLREGFERKAVEFQDILKMGRTQLQDAVPMTLGQEFRAFRICPIVIVLVSLEKFFRIHLKNALLTWNKRPHTNPCGSADVKIVVGFSVLHGKDIQASDNQFLNAVAVQVIQNIRQPF